MLKGLKTPFHVKGPHCGPKRQHIFLKKWAKNDPPRQDRASPPTRVCGFPLCDQQPSGTVEKQWEEGGARLPFNREALNPLACGKVPLLL